MFSATDTTTKPTSANHWVLLRRGFLLNYTNSPKHHHQANVQWTAVHYLISIDCTLWLSGCFPLAWLNDLIMSQSPRLPGAPAQTTPCEQLTVKPITLQGQGRIQDCHSQCPQLSSPCCPTPPSAVHCRIPTAVKKLGEQQLVRNQYLGMVHNPKSLGGTSVISKVQACVQASLVYSYFYQQHENHLSNISEHHWFQACWRHTWRSGYLYKMSILWSNYWHWKNLAIRNKWAFFVCKQIVVWFIRDAPLRTNYSRCCLCFQRLKGPTWISYKRVTIVFNPGLS